MFSIGTNGSKENCLFIWYEKFIEIEGDNKIITFKVRRKQSAAYETLHEFKIILITSDLYMINT